MGKTRKHAVTNKLKHSVRNNRMWKMKIEKDKKKEQKKIGDLNERDYNKF
jgi:hypothetical protein